MDLLCNSCKKIGTCPVYERLRKVHPVFCDHPERDQYMKMLQVKPNGSDFLKANPRTFHYN